jgi:hypothetical protein
MKRRGFLEKGERPRLIFGVPQKGGFFRVFLLIRVRFLGEKRKISQKQRRAELGGVLTWQNSSLS